MPVSPAMKKANITAFDTGSSSGVAPGAALTSNWKAGDVVDCGKYRTATVQLFVDSAASSSSPQVEVIFMVSNAATTPLATDDVWVAASQQDIASTDGAVTGSFPSGIDMTVTPNWGKLVTRPLIWQTKVSTAVTDKFREPVLLDVTGWRWLCVLGHELGDTTHPSTLVVYVGLSA